MELSTICGYRDGKVCRLGGDCVAYCPLDQNNSDYKNRILTVAVIIVSVFGMMGIIAWAIVTAYAAGWINVAVQ